MPALSDLYRVRESVLTPLRRFCLVSPFAVLALLWLCPQPAWSDPPQSDERAAAPPHRYFVDYRPAERFCPPIRTAFADAARTTGVNRGKPYTQHANGGYGVAMMQVAGRPIFHTGADLGWFRTGEPVFAIADGAVRLSQPGMKAMLAEAGIRPPDTNAPFDYGNLIVIEHRTPDDEYFCSLYAHLGNDRMVHPGELVTAGQQIGTIGRKHGAVNGGHESHLHFAIIEGRFIPTGETLFEITTAAGRVSVELQEPGELRSRVRLSPESGEGFQVTINGALVTITHDEDGDFLPSSVLYWAMPRSTGCRFVGYSPSLDGWVDPVRFLRERAADRNPAPPMFVTPIQREENDPPVRNVLNSPAPSWKVDEWVQPADAGDLDVEDFRGKVVCLVCFQAGCRASQTHALPALQQLARHFSGNDAVAVVGLQTAVSNRRRNTPLLLKKLAERLQLDVPLGHCDGDARTPPIVDAYALRGTPWTVIIDRDGTIQFSNYAVRAEELIHRAEALLEQ